MDESAMDEAMGQKSDMRVVGCGCLIVLALLLAAASMATAVVIDRAFDKEVAAYSVCEGCGLILDAGNVHAACAGEEAVHE